MRGSTEPALTPAAYEVLLAYPGEAVSIVQEDGEMRYASPSHTSLLGYEQAQLIGTPILSWIHRADRRAVEEALSLARTNSEPVTVRFRSRHRSRKWRVIEAVVADYLSDADVSGFVLWSRDITETAMSRGPGTTGEKGRRRLVGPATDSALLERMVEERTRELSTLLDVSRTVASTLELEPLLSHVLDALQQFVGYDGMSVSVVDDDELLIVVGRPGQGEERPETRRTPFAERSNIWDLVAQGSPVIIDDVQGRSRLARLYRRVAREAGYPDVSGFRSWMGVPLLLQGQVMGALSIVDRRPAAFTEHHAALVAGVTQQVAIAVENVRLYRRAQETAVLEERQRISRELHDSVSQALYSIGLGARTARALLQREPARVEEPLEFVMAQAERGLAEMRALIFELRPEVLEQEGLTSALRKQADALQARHRLTMELTLCEEPPISPRVKEAAYRIAQEAMQNVVKHAGAGRAHLILMNHNGNIVLEVRDNGKGFDPEGSFPGHLGLRSMRERAARVGGSLEITSTPGAGTTLRLLIPISAGG